MDPLPVASPAAPPTASPARLWALGAVAVVVTTLAASAWRFVVPEIYMRLALGRLACTEGLTLPRDPYLFSEERAWVNPEWLGDLSFYAAHELAGAPGVIGFRIGLVVLGALLSLAAARQLGASPPIASALLVVVLAAAVPRLTDRNEVHLVWLLPLSCLALFATHSRWHWAMLPISLLWVNLHGSFVLAWVLVGARLLDRVSKGERSRRELGPLALILLLEPLLPLATPAGLGTYGFVWEHITHGAMLEAEISEWRSPDAVPATPAALAIQLLVVAGLVSALFPLTRREVGRGLVLLLAAVLVFRAVRFAPLGAWLAFAPLAANLTTLAPSRIVARTVAALAALGSLALIWSGQAELARVPDPLSPVLSATEAARFLGREAAPGSRVFNPFNQSQVLMWFSPRTRLFITAHTPYVAFDAWRAASTSDVAFEETMRRHDVDYVLLHRDPRSTAPGLWSYLEHHPHWHAVYRDETAAVFAPGPEADGAP